MPHHMSFDLALTAAAAAAERARHIGKPFAITIVDPGGNTILQHRFDGIHAAATTVSAAKARAAALFNRPSGDVEKLVSDPERPGLRDLTTVLDDVLAIQGAVPVRADDGALLGAVGASGGTPAEDEDVARAAIDAIGG
ncbi:Uncharacterized conserved protein GlcG, DUF336 family [Williamsia serinedens]|uniref:Uncharacterized conserved protein GlcG, DUF336 family n=2 Tax=Williamsia serinedens TaxID=391736 RepID=A0ABT1H8R5_9NOCA|nr:Uncharacterized conserved protein GlcG, DUF336 family [Williamsia serinedens]